MTTAAATPAPIWLTTTEVCDHARVSRRIVYNAIRAGRLRAATIDGRGDYRFRIEWVDAWIEALAPVELPPGLRVRVGRR